MIILAEKIKLAVTEWRKQGYPHISLVSRRLLDFWFKEEHLLADGSPFTFWSCQQEAIESLIYLYEVCGYQNLYDLARGFGAGISVNPSIDLWPKYCFKMATGSGKTWVMALAIVWQYFNKIYSDNCKMRFSSHFLLLAPNLIVLDRLKEAFVDNKVFRDFPFIPPEWQKDFSMETIQQSETTPATAQGIIHLTNVQQLYERKNADAINPLEEILGPKPKPEEEILYESLRLQLARYEDLIILNDEGHHVHSDDLEWYKIIADLNERLEKGLVMQLDFTATPKDLHGKYFPHIICDYSLAQAITDGIVKRPRIGEISKAPDLSAEKDFVRKNRLQIDTGVKILKEFQDELTVLGVKPVLFIMTDETRNADKVGEYLSNQGFPGKVLVIHTDRKGVITKLDLEKVRIAAREIDNPKSPYEVIVSVMMLKEGWDVRNVCVIVPLRAFDSPILPEQTLGRGLRRMFPTVSGLTEKLVVIDHPKFRQLWEAEISSGELIADIVPAEKVYQPDKLIIVDDNKLEFDLEIPVLQGGLTRTIPDLSQFKIDQLPSGFFLLSEIELPKIMYREKDLLEQKIVREIWLAFDYTENFSLYLSYICQAIVCQVGMRTIFSVLVPLVSDYIQNHLFGETIDTDNKEAVQKLNHIPVREKIVEIFSQKIIALAKKVEKTNLLYYFLVSGTEPFHTSEPIYQAKKSVFNQLPYSRKGPFELAFMEFLDQPDNDVLAFTKVFLRHPLHIPYCDFEGYLHYYLPDFVVKTTQGMFLVETKGGTETAEVVLKDQVARLWCENVSSLTENRWKYLKVKPTNLTEDIFI